MVTTVKGLVLRRTNFAEADRILTVLTERKGKISVSARGARNLKSKLNAATQPFCYAEFDLYEGRSFYILQNVQPIASFFELQRELGAMALASYFAQVLDYATDDYLPEDEILRLALNCLHLLASGARGRKLIKAVFELRLPTLCGYRPALDTCDRCGAAPADAMRFGPLSATVRCERCHAARPDGDFTPVTPSELAAMRHIVSRPLERLFAFELAEPSLSMLAQHAERFLLARFDRAFPTLDFYHSVEV